MPFYFKIFEAAIIFAYMAVRQTVVFVNCAVKSCERLYTVSHKKEPTYFCP